METGRSVRSPAIARPGQLAAGAGGVFDDEVGAGELVVLQ